MKIAIPAFHTKVSPRFDNAQELVLLEVLNGEVIHRERQPLQAYSAAGKIKKLLENGVDTLICGGIDRLSQQQMGFNRIEVYSWVTGEIDDAVNCFLRNGLNSGTILGSNGKKEGQWRFRQRGFLRNVLQKGNSRVSAEADRVPESDRDRRACGQKGAGRGGRRVRGMDSSGRPGRNKKRRETGQKTQ